MEIVIIFSYLVKQREMVIGVESVMSLKKAGSATVQSTQLSIPMATTGYLETKQKSLYAFISNKLF
jgi:hypothetical protein